MDKRKRHKSQEQKNYDTRLFEDNITKIMSQNRFIYSHAIVASLLGTHDSTLSSGLSGERCIPDRLIRLSCVYSNLPQNSIFLKSVSKMSSVQREKFISALDVLIDIKDLIGNETFEELLLAMKNLTSL